MALLVCAAILGAGGCARTVSSKSSDQPDLAEITAKPLPPEKAQEMLGEVGENWLYGEGVGDTAVTVGTVVLFPPYLVWVLGNAALSLTGYEPLRVSDMLPERQGQSWKQTYSAVVSGPGKFSAALAGEEFRSPELARENLRKYTEPVEASTAQAVK